MNNTEQFLLSANLMTGKTRKINAINDLVKSYDGVLVNASDIDNFSSSIDREVEEFNNQYASRRAYVTAYRITENNKRPMVIIHIEGSDCTASFGFKPVKGTYQATLSPLDQLLDSLKQNG